MTKDVYSARQQPCYSLGETSTMGASRVFPFRIAKRFPAPSIRIFVALQLLDVLTTLIGLQMGAQEASGFVGRLMQIGPVAALLIAKLFAVLLVCAALKFKRPRMVVFLNYWFAAVVSWNLGVILLTLLRNR